MNSSLKVRIDKVILNIDDCLVRLATALLIEFPRSKQKPTISDAVLNVHKEFKTILFDLQNNKLTGDILYFNWIAEDLIKIKNILCNIDIKRVMMHKKAKQSTLDIFENPIIDALDKIVDTTSGTIACSKKIFEESNQYGKHSPETLSLIYEIQKKSLIIKRQLKLLYRPFLSFMATWKFILFAFSISLICAFTAYIINTNYKVTKNSSISIKQQMLNDGHTIISKAQDPTNNYLERTINIIKQISELVGTVPNVLIGLAILLGIFQRILLIQSWKSSNLASIRGSLIKAAQLIRAN